MTVWFTADLHLGHENIIRYCRRPFVDTAEMNHSLIERWNDTVDESDDVWVLGDFALGKIAETLPLASTLHGHKLLVAGNHDRCRSGHGSKDDGWRQRYLDAGFAEVHQGQVDLSVGGVEVDACHFPYRGDSLDRDRHVEHRPVDRGRWLLHGHVHGTWLQHGRMINVGVDAWDYRPVSESRIHSLMAGGPQDRPCQSDPAGDDDVDSVGGSSGDDPGLGLAGNPGDQLEVGVVVEDR